MRATINPTWIDVLVGLGNCCGAPGKGLLANANGNVNQIAARDGTVLTNPPGICAFSCFVVAMK